MKLVVFRGDAVESEVRLGDGTLKVGRDPRNDVVLDDPEKGVSRFHCEIRADRGRFVIVDTKSRNGIYIGGGRVRGSAEFTVGVAVVVGSFELMLENDVPATVVVDSRAVGTPLGQRGEPGGQPATMSARAASNRFSLPRWLQSRQTQLWAAAALLIIVLGGLTWVVVRNLTAPPPEPVAAAADIVAPSPLPPDDAETVRQDEIQSLAVQIDNALHANDTELARAQIARLRELDPTHPQLPGFEAGLNTVPEPPPAPEPIRPAAPAKPKPVDNPELARNPGESDADYQARFRRAEGNLSEAVVLLARDEFAAAIARLTNIRREAPGFRNSDNLLAEATDKQRLAFNEAFDGGQKNENAGLLKAARGWYQRAADLDPASTPAGEKLAAVKKRIFARAQESMDTAGFHAKSGNKVLAIRSYEEAKSVLDDRDELYVRANQGIEALKR